MAIPTPRTALLGLLISLVSLALPGTALAQVSPCGLANVESATCASLVGLGPGSTAYQISADGHTVVGAHDGLPARWVDGVLHPLGPLPAEASAGFASAATSDGSLIVGRLTQDAPNFWVAYKWTPTEGLQVLALPGYWPYPNDVSEDGRVIGGSLDGVHAALWVDSVLHDLEEEFGSGRNVEALSADGSVAVGNGRNWINPGSLALRWDSSGMVNLMSTWFAIGDDVSRGHAYGATPDGSIAVGSAQRPIPSPGPWPLSRPEQPVRWDDTAPRFYDVGGFPGGSALDLSADASRVVGWVGAGITFEENEAASWDADGSLRLVSIELADLGVDLTGWTLWSAVAVSDDGQTLTGQGSFGGVDQGFVATFSPTVGLDVVPRSSSNFIVAHPYGRVTVDLYGSDSLDVAALDLGLLGFGPAGAPVVKSFRPKDLNRDGHLDRRLIFEVPASGLVPGDTEACLTAAGALPFRVCSPVQVTAGDCGLGFEVAPLLPLLMAWRRRRSARRSV